MNCLKATRRAWLVVVVVLAGLVVSPPVSDAAVVRPFGTRFTINTTGTITMTGNTILTCPTSASGCAAARTGTGSTLNANNNNNFSMVFVDIDGDPSTFASSRNTLSIPTTSTVLFAGLYWGADTTAGGGSGSPAPTPAARNQVLLRAPGNGAYVPITASQVDTSPVTGGVRYQGFADVTSLVQTGRSGEYTVANVQAGRGTDRYGGWALVVALQDPNQPLRNLTVFDGYAVVQQTPSIDQNVAIPVSGFVTPQSGPVRSRVGVVTYEGDLGLLGDSLRLNSTALTNSLNPSTNFFNSSLTGFGSTNTTGDPFQTNMLGFDIDTINADGVLTNGATSATINLNTNNDTYFPGVVSFSTELFAPRLDLRKSGVDVNGGALDVGDEVKYTIEVTNNGQDAAANVVLADAIPAGATYVPGSLVIDDISVTDGTGDDPGELASGPSRIIARLGTGATASAGGSMPIGRTRTVTFRVTVDTALANDVLSNTATATYIGTTSGLPLEGSSNRVDMSVRSRSDLTVSKFGPTERITVPGPTSFRIVVVNRGPAAEPAAVVTDTLPTGFTASAVTTSRGVCTIGANIRCDLGVLGVGDSAIIDISATANSGSGSVTNVASVTGSNLDLFPNNNTASAVVQLNRPPTAIDQVASTASSTAVVIPVQTGATDPDGDELTTVSAGPASGGAVTVNGDGTVTYTPNPGFKGVDTFTYTITDGSATATATVTVTVANAAPIAVDDSRATLPGAPIIVNVVANDSDPNGDPLSVTAITQPAAGATTGVAVNNNNGTVTFTPDGAFQGIATFSYTISDGTDTATANVSVAVPNSAPVAVADAASTPSGVAVTVDVLANDLDDNNQPLSVSLITQPGNGLAVNDGGGLVTYTPSAGFKGVDTFTYTITDGSATASASVTVTVANAAPTADPDSAATPSGAQVDVDVLANDNDANADPLTIIELSTPSNGTATRGLVGIVTYTPDAGFKGVDSFTYTISDGTDTATATVTIAVANQPPAAAADRRNTETNTPVTVPVLANDFDANADPLSVVGTTAAGDGGVVVNGDGTVTYTPDAGFKGVDSFTYTISDGTDTATATVTVTVGNAVPVAVDDSASTAVGAPVTVAVLANDSDLNGDSLSVVTVSAAGDGGVVVNGDGTVTYTPDAGFKGVDSFTYTISDGTDTATATVTVTVAPGSGGLPLPVTGSNSDRILGLGFTMIIGGAALLLLARRRNEATAATAVGIDG